MQTKEAVQRKNSAPLLWYFLFSVFNRFVVIVCFKFQFSQQRVTLFCYEVYFIFFCILLGVTTRQCMDCEVCALIEHVFTHACYTFRNYNTCEVCAPRKCMSVYTCYTFGNTHFCVVTNIIFQHTIFN